MEKSRGFINDVPTTLDMMKKLGEQLVDVHSQFQTLKLNEKEYQFYILDSIGNNQEIIKKYQNNYKSITSLKNEINSLKTEIEESKKTYEYNLFLYEELNSLNLDIDEQKKLEDKSEILNNSEELAEILNKSFQTLNNDNLGVVNNLGIIKKDLEKFIKIDSSIKDIYERVNENFEELKDITVEIENYSNNLEFDPQKQKEYNDRLDIIYNLQKKHNANNIEKLLEIKDNLEMKTLNVSKLENQLNEKENKLSKNIKINTDIAEELYKNRLSAKHILEKSILETISKLGMEKADIDIKISKKEEFNYFGFNEVEFMFSANAGTTKTNIIKSISGGELSRIMLAIKKELGKNINLPSIIFDEIDTGVSGNIADKMGEIMQTMSEKIQVISITHLAQVASKGKKHYKVLKKEKGGTTISEILELNKEERIEEIAKMISGEIVSNSAISYAKEMLKRY